MAALKPELDLAGYDFALDPSSIRHVRAAHGDAATEAGRGRDPVTVQDFALLPTVLNAADASIAYAGLTRESRSPLVRISARLDGQTYITVWRILSKRRMLALQSFFKGVKKPWPTLAHVLNVSGV